MFRLPKNNFTKLSQGWNILWFGRAPIKLTIVGSSPERVERFVKDIIRPCTWIILELIVQLRKIWRKVLSWREHIPEFRCKSSNGFDIWTKILSHPFSEFHSRAVVIMNTYHRTFWKRSDNFWKLWMVPCRQSFLDTLSKVLVQKWKLVGHKLQ